MIAELPANPPTPHLTATEWKVLEVLAANRGSLVTKRKILDAGWGANYAEENGSLRLFLSPNCAKN
jgi:DNA-binding response OmpR family regulator